MGVVVDASVADGFCRVVSSCYAVYQAIFSSPHFPLSLFIQPIFYLFTGFFFLNVKRSPLETYHLLLSSSEFKMMGAVPPQFQIPPCRIKESPLKILISIFVLRSYRLPISRIICIQN
jgi:hypothetical protein